MQSNGNNNNQFEYNMNRIVKADNIYKSYSKSKTQQVEVLKDLSLDIEEGKITVVIGASGAGKTTVLRALAGLITPASGTISLGGHSCFDEKKGINIKVQKRIFTNGY